MPMYVYRCPACGFEVEELRSIANRDVNPPQCGVFEATNEHNPDLMVIMVRVPTTGKINMKGFSAVNGYSRTDTGWQRSADHPGIKTRVYDAAKEAE